MKTRAMITVAEVKSMKRNARGKENVTKGRKGKGVGKRLSKLLTSKTSKNEMSQSSSDEHDAEFILQ